MEGREIVRQSRVARVLYHVGQEIPLVCGIPIMAKFSMIWGDQFERMLDLGEGVASPGHLADVRQAHGQLQRRLRLVILQYQPIYLGAAQRQPVMAVLIHALRRNGAMQSATTKLR